MSCWKEELALQTAAMFGIEALRSGPGSEASAHAVDCIRAGHVPWMSARPHAASLAAAAARSPLDSAAGCMSCVRGPLLVVNRCSAPRPRALGNRRRPAACCVPHLSPRQLSWPLPAVMQCAHERMSGPVRRRFLSTSAAVQFMLVAAAVRPTLPLHTLCYRWRCSMSLLCDCDPVAAAVLAALIAVSPVCLCRSVAAEQRRR